MTKRRRSRTPDLSIRCPRCLFRPEDCLCPDIPSLTTRTTFVLLRHAAERRRTTNSGRWAALALGCPILEHGLPDQALDEAPLREPGTAVLFPDGDPEAALRDPPRRVIVLDASWAQARRMLQRIPSLRTLPRFALPPATSPSVNLGAPRLRAPTRVEGMSTIEAMARALERLGEPEPAAALDRVYAEACRRVWTLRAGPLE